MAPPPAAHAMITTMVGHTRGLMALAVLAVGAVVGCSGGGPQYSKPTVNFDAAPDRHDAADAGTADAPGLESSPDSPEPDGPEAGSGGDAGADRALCPTDVPVTIYCLGSNVFEHAPEEDCIGGRVYGICPHGCALDMVQGPLADPLAALCSTGAEASDASTDGEPTCDAGCSDGGAGDAVDDHADAVIETAAIDADTDRQSNDGAPQGD